MKIRLRSTERDCRPTARRPARIAGADPAQDARSAPAPVAVTWAGAQLQERIRQAGLRCLAAELRAGRRTK
jgi:hypothetical protein